MSYERTGLGFSDPRGTCSQIANGETRCFRPSETAAATRNRCRTLSPSQSCTVSGASGSMYCCPQFGSTRAPATSQSFDSLLDTLATTGGGSPSGGGALTQAVNTVKGILGFGVGVSQTTGVNVEAANEKGSPTAQGFANYAKGVATQEAAAVEEDTMGPAEDAPGGSPGDWLSRYQTHITIASTAIGLVTFAIWLVARKKK